MTQKEKFLLYKEKKGFGFSILPTFNKSDLNKAFEILKEQKADFEYIHISLNDNERLEFKNHYCNQLEKLKVRQEFSKYNDLIEKQINEVNIIYEDLNTLRNDLLKKFKAIGFLDYELLIKELKEYRTVNDKLDYLKKVKAKYYDKYQLTINSFSEEEKIYFYTAENRIEFWETVFGDCNLVTMLNIQEPVHKLYFENSKNTPEYTFWFIKFNAETYFNIYINEQEFENKISSNLKDTFIKAELKQLNEQEKKAQELLLNKELDIYKPHPNNYKYSKEVDLLRVLDGNYFKDNTCQNVNGFGGVVNTYFKHILLKPYLEELLKADDYDKINKKVLKKSFNEPVKLSYYERINRELNIIELVYKCQFMEASKNINANPILHSKGRLLSGFYNIKSNIEMFRLQDYIEHYTDRFENSSNTVLIESELLKIHEKTKAILLFYNENLTLNKPIVTEYLNHIPKKFEQKQEYFDKHTGFIIVQNLYPQHIVFGKEEWNEIFNYNYVTTNKELALFCHKLIDFIENFKLNTEVAKYPDLPKINELNNDLETQPENYESQDKPNFASSIVDEVYTILKEHFNEQEHNTLENLLKNGIEPKNKLYFRNNSNKLTDALKKLYEANLITQCNKAKLEKWVCDNFQFKNRRTNKKQDFKLKTVQDVISNRNSKQPCKNPLFSILNGSIIN